ncbi:MAG: acyl-CoA dehydratase activase-related protein [Syntrophales bacterium]|jgi:predicted CoA-substrate-specific enzyme activase|nr:acyl-CoA dehydratase activase-related protein [Syntrophales bacterium]MDY0043884.1 acyl-CoA dehydratase activase-related protein [Syntrophales bacterium]
MNLKRLPAGVDVGSTTAKVIILDGNGKLKFSSYRRHGADIVNTLTDILKEAEADIGNCLLDLSITGSAGIGVAERIGIPFVQEVVAAGEVTRRYFPDVKTLIDIGGEDSKMMFFSPERPPDIRMNGSCAGGTGAFIDQMATLLNLSLQDLDRLAAEKSRLYPIASRCGVFAKTDIQNLVSRKIPLSDICASILHAVALQNLNSLTRGTVVSPQVLFCGGPLTFFVGLRNCFTRLLGLAPKDAVLPSKGLFFPAWGAALSAVHSVSAKCISEWRNQISLLDSGYEIRQQRLTPLFTGEADYRKWKQERKVMKIDNIDISLAEPPFFLGIDCGSTTTKVVIIDSCERTVFSDYRPNRGNPVDTVMHSLIRVRNVLKKNGKEVSLSLAAGKATGYGEDLVCAAFGLQNGVVETIAHLRAAVKCDPNVTFILDIGGQDMKALFVRGRAVSRIEINEACSSGCGSFIEGFAQSLGMTAETFSCKACSAKAPCALGTRCTVFMNSRIKQAQRENAAINDIAAGLAYSVVKNTLYKVLKLHDCAELGEHIIVQGGTFRNQAVLRAFEILSGATVTSSDKPEMMGAYGAALLSKDAYNADSSSVTPFTLDTLELCTRYEIKEKECRGCANQCKITAFLFSGGRIFVTGNKCERFYGNKGRITSRGKNFFSARNDMLFNRSLQPLIPSTGLSIGIPRILGMYEDFPFWSTLLTGCGFEVVLSNRSNQALYEKGLGSVMADNICFPAKLAHGHMIDLLEKKVDRIFYPLTVHEIKEESNAANSFSCPIVGSYAEVLKSAVEAEGIPFDAPAVSFRDTALLKKACFGYLKSLGVSRSRFENAFFLASKAHTRFRENLIAGGRALLDEVRKKRDIVIVLAGRPYHADPLIEHETSEILADLGANVIPCDVASFLCKKSILEVNSISQWAFPNRLMRAAQWVADQEEHTIQYVMLNSFGCGPDAFIIDEIKDILSAAGKPFTLIKIDEISSTGSARLRLRSLMESLKSAPKSQTPAKRRSSPPYKIKDRSKRIIAPYFADCYSPFFSPIFRLLGYDLEILPPPDRESVEYGLKYANNEICYPAIIVIGDLIKAFRSGSYDPGYTVAGISQTGGQCRASNYIALIKKALISAGYPEVSVIAAAHENDLVNDQPGFEIDVKRIIRPAFTSLLYADAIARMYYKTVVRERESGIAAKIRDHYLSAAFGCIERDDTKELFKHLKKAVSSFNGSFNTNSCLPKIGIVGEIYLKYNSFSQMNAIDWIISQNVEVTVPALTDFMMQFFVNIKVNRKNFLERQNGISRLFEAFLQFKAALWIDRFEQVLQHFRCYEPPAGIFQKAGLASKIVNLSNQFGEGWLIPGEIAGFARAGIWDIVCLQPFGCIANQVVAKGIETRIMKIYPMLNLLFLDFDAGTSEVNILNRLHFMIENARQHYRSPKRKHA